MKIGTPPDKPSLATPGPADAAASSTRPGGPGATALAPAAGRALDAPSARVELSSAAAALLGPAGTPEFDAEKVARLSKAIEDGSFKVDPQAIADKLIANAQELLGRVKP